MLLASEARRVCMTKKDCSIPLISVIVPVYNIEHYLERCIESIITQTYANLEIILVDDGSTDCSGKICDEYAKKDERIKVIHKANGGLVSARKAGIVEASGDYATYVDGDDWIEKNMYEHLFARIEDADIIISGVVRDYKSHSVCEVNKLSEGIYQGISLQTVYKNMICTEKFFERGVQPHVINVLCKKKLLLENQMQIPNEINVGEDTACIYPVLLNAKKIVLINECLYHYVMRTDSIMGTNDGKEIDRYRFLYRYFKDRFSDVIDCKKELMMQLDYLLIYFLLLKEMSIFQSAENVVFPYADIPCGSKVIVYGTGRFGKELMRYLKESKILSVVLWVDNSEIDKLKEFIALEEYDYVIIAVLLNEIVSEIEQTLLKVGMTADKIRKIDIGQIDKMISKVDYLLGK